MNFQAMTIKTKLYLSYGLLAVLALTMGVGSIFIIHGLGATAQDLGVRHATKIFDAGTISANSAEFLSLVRGIYVRQENGNYAAAQEYVEDYSKNEADLRKAVADMRATDLSPKGAQMIDDLEALVNSSDPMYARFLTLVRAKSYEPAYQLYTSEMMPVLKKVDDQGLALLLHERDRMNEINAQVQQDISRDNWTMVVLLAITVLVGGFLVFVIRGFDAQLRQSVQDLIEGSEQVSSAATQVSSSSQSLARDTSEQAAMIEETSASAEQINSMARRNAENARNATSLVVEAVKTTEQTNVAVAECVQAMDAIGESSSKIAKTLQVIDKIAFQTNILALNAAVEAARAGEAGMGFAVVAEEVRNLAQRCASASEEISTLIEQSLGNSDAGRIKIAGLVEAGEKVNQVFATMKTLVEEISQSSEEQGRGIDQIGRAIQKMEQGTQKSAANAEESAAAAEELNAQSEALMQVGSGLSLMVGTAQDASTRHRTAPVSAPRPAPRQAVPPAARRFTPAKAPFLKPALAMASPAGSFPLDGDDNFTEF